MNKEKTTSEKKALKAIPAGFHSVTPFLIVNNASMFMEFLKEAFNAQTTYIMKDNNGKVMHATVKIGDSVIMMSDSNERFQPMPSMLYLYVEDVDATYKQALNAKGVSLREPADEFYGDRSSGIKDPWNNQWWIASHIEDVSEAEMKKRMERFQKQEA